MTLNPSREPLVAKMVKSARTGRGLSQAALAARAGLAPRSVWLLEKGGGQLATFDALALALDLRISGLPRGRTIGDRLSVARKSRKWSQEKLAQKSGLSVPTIANLERGSGRVSSLEKVLRLLAPQARERKPEIANWLGGKRNVRFTPRWMLEAVEEAFGRISLDPCHGEGSFVRAERYIDEKQDGITSRWSGRLAWVNPPYSAASAWMQRCHGAWATGEVLTVVALIPVRTNTRTFVELVAGQADTIFVEGRPIFFDPARPGHKAQCAFGVQICVWGGSTEQVHALQDRLGGVLLPKDARVVRIEPEEKSSRMKVAA